MAIRKIKDLPKTCRDPDHNPPSHMYLENGVYEHECNACGKKTVFTVQHPEFVTPPPPVGRSEAVWRGQYNPTVTRTFACLCEGYPNHAEGCPNAQP